MANAKISGYVVTAKIGAQKVILECECGVRGIGVPCTVVKIDDTLYNVYIQGAKYTAKPINGL